MMPRLVPLALVLVLGAAACSGDETDLNTEGPAQIRVDVEQRNGSGERGSVALFPRPDRRTQVSIELNSMPRDTPQPASIHAGTCDALEDEALYKLNPVRPNRNGSGRSLTTIAVGLEELEAGPHALNVVRSASSKVAVACGDLPNP